MQVCVCGCVWGRECDVRIIIICESFSNFAASFSNSTSIYSSLACALRQGQVLVLVWGGGVVGLFDARYAAQPRLVECRAHIHARQIRRRTLDAMRHGAGQLVASVGTLQHQGATAVALETEAGME